MNNEAWQTANLKLIGPCRDQMQMLCSALDLLLPPEHLARAVWAFVEAMDTRPCFSYVNSFIGCTGRPTTSPKILLAVWIYSILEGNCSARKLEELCKNHNAYKWIVGEAPINRTMLAEFRSKDPMKFEDLLTNCLAVMLKTGLINDQDFSQDGTRIKADAGLGSFKREESLEKLKEEILNYIKHLCTLSSENEYQERTMRRKKQIAKDRLERVEEALRILDIEREIKTHNSKKNHNGTPSQEVLKEVRASTTDPVVRKMKMGDGGFRLAYNVQLATGLDSRVVYGVDVVTTLDPGTASRMMAKVHSRMNKLNMQPPKNWVVDAAYSGAEDINCVSDLFPNCRYYASPQYLKNGDPKKYKRGDSEAVKKWRDSIGTEEVNELYKKRCSTAEFSNAQLKNCGLRQFLVRGLAKVKGMTLLHVIALNVSRYLDLSSKMVANGA